MTKIFEVKVTTEEKQDNINKLKEIVNKITIDDDYFIIVKKLNDNTLRTSIFDGTNTYINQAVCVVGLIEDLGDFVKEQTDNLNKK